MKARKSRDTVIFRWVRVDSPLSLIHAVGAARVYGPRLRNDRPTCLPR